MVLEISNMGEYVTHHGATALVSNLTKAGNDCNDINDNSNAFLTGCHAGELQLQLYEMQVTQADS